MSKPNCETAASLRTRTVRREGRAESETGTHLPPESDSRVRGHRRLQSDASGPSNSSTTPCTTETFPARPLAGRGARSDGAHARADRNSMFRLVWAEQKTEISFDFRGQTPFLSQQHATAPEKPLPLSSSRRTSSWRWHSRQWCRGGSWDTRHDQSGGVRLRSQSGKSERCFRVRAGRSESARTSPPRSRS